jgi:hypothetical protein
VPTNPPLDLTLSTAGGEGRTLSEWLTTFHLAAVLVDPYTNESSWVLETAARVLRTFGEADVRVSWVATAEADDARAFLGPLAEEFLTFVDPDRAVVRALGLTHLPAFVFLRMDGSVAAAAEGWDPRAWRDVADVIASTTSWSRATIPLPGDPVAFAGSPALG